MFSTIKSFCLNYFSPNNFFFSKSVVLHMFTYRNLYVKLVYGHKQGWYLPQKLLQQSYEEEILKMTLHKYYEYHHEMVDQYDVS